MSYPTFDHLPDLSAAEMAAAMPLSFVPYVPGTPSKFDSWLSYRTYKTIWAQADFSFTAQAGGTYEILSTSHFDPTLLRVFDDKGNTIAMNDGMAPRGSHHATFIAPYSGKYYTQATWNIGREDDQKIVSISIWQDLDNAPLLTPPTFQPSGNLMPGTAGNDKFIVTAQNDAVSGGDGFDTLTFPWNKADYNVIKSMSNVSVTEKTNAFAQDTATDVERLIFADMVISYETSGAAAEVYRLYKASFDRAPDAKGIGFWINAMENGATLSTVAAAFVSSPEFQSLYGNNPSNADVLTAVYQNVLHRAPDPGGFDFWLGNMDSKAISRADMIVQFSESAENQAQVIGSLTAGFEFIY